MEHTTSLSFDRFTGDGCRCWLFFYDASTFAVQNIDFEGDNLYLDTSLKIQPGSWKGKIFWRI